MIVQRNENERSLGRRCFALGRVCVLRSGARLIGLRSVQNTGKSLGKQPICDVGNLARLRKTEPRVDNVSSSVDIALSYRQLATHLLATVDRQVANRHASATSSTRWWQVINRVCAGVARMQVTSRSAITTSSPPAIDNQALRIPTTTDFSLTN